MLKPGDSTSVGVVHEEDVDTIELQLSAEEMRALLRAAAAAAGPDVVTSSELYDRVATEHEAPIATEPRSPPLIERRAAALARPEPPNLAEPAAPRVVETPRPAHPTVPPEIPQLPVHPAPTPPADTPRLMPQLPVHAVPTPLPAETPRLMPQSPPVHAALTPRPADTPRLVPPSPPVHAAPIPLPADTPRLMPQSPPVHAAPMPLPAAAPRFLPRAGHTPASPIPSAMPAKQRWRTTHIVLAVTAFLAGLITSVTYVAMTRETPPLLPIAEVPAPVVEELPPLPPETPPAAEAPAPEPVLFRNPFDRAEVFEFPAGTTQAEARDAVAEILMQRARERVTLPSELRRRGGKTAERQAPVERSEPPQS